MSSPTFQAEQNPALGQPLLIPFESIIDLNQYPILDLNTDAGKSFADQCRAEYLATGLCMLSDFIQPLALETLADEANAVCDKAYFCKSMHDAYLATNNETDGMQTTNRQEYTFVGSVAYDFIDEGTLLRQLYNWDPLKDFIGYVLGKDQFYRAADPLGALSINVFTDGGEHGWHFDESEYTVTLMLQPPEEGGEFEFVPQLRDQPDEATKVDEVLNGKRDGVTRLAFTPGTLLIFGGNKTIHRVTRVKGAKPRLVPVLCYCEQPDQVNSEAVRKLFWGRTG